MESAIHHSYMQMLEEIKEENSVLSAPRRLDSTWAIPESKRPTLVKKRIPWVHIVAAAAILFTLAVLIEGLIHSRYAVAAKPLMEVTHNEKADDFDHQMDLVKRILVSLVGTVDELSNKVGTVNREPVIPSETELSNYRVLVTAQRANLREQPDANSRSLMIVPKDTELFGSELGNGWLKVTTPLGREAWILKDLVAFQEL